MKDIQSQHDSRRINIKKVGVKDINYPITVLDRANQVQHTVARVNMYVNLPHRFKGTHMSRFIEILNRVHGKITIKSLHSILHQMKERLQAEAAHLEIEFPYFLKKNEGDAVNISEYSCAMHGSLDQTEQLSVTVRVPIAPPSPTQGDRMLPRSLGHWGTATVSIRFRQFIWIEDLITMIEEITSHRLNWPDDCATQPSTCLSVERMTTAIGERLRSHPDISWFVATVENLSTGYSTFASLEWPENQES